MARRPFFQNVNVQIVEEPVKKVGAVGVDLNIGFVRTLRQGELTVKATVAFYKPEIAFRDLEKQFPEIEFVYPNTLDELALELPETEILVILGTMYNSQVAKLVIEQGKNIQWIQSTTVGVDAFLELGYPNQAILTKGTGIWDTSVAEHALAFILALKRNIIELERVRQSRLWDRERLWGLMGSLAGKTVGIAGYGSIGKEIAKTLSGFDVKIIAYDQFPGVGDNRIAELFTKGEFPSFLKECDVVILVMPYTKETEYIVDEEQFRCMKPSAILINVGRGKLVKESALVKALERGQIAGAGIDVFEEEPLPSTSKLWDLPNVILSPHCAAAGDNDLLNTCRLLKENLKRYLEGQELLYKVDRTQEY
ncbi:MAG TPA: D-2-hydroxyacid dehydrogenase [Clostridia bacterium]|nr:D-2-hydroxyacid dehydrogenase [Clostridia bacterium]